MRRARALYVVPPLLMPPPPPTTPKRPRPRPVAATEAVTAEQMRADLARLFGEEP